MQNPDSHPCYGIGCFTSLELVNRATQSRPRNRLLVSLQPICHAFQATEQAACIALASQPRGLRGSPIKVGYSFILRSGSLNRIGYPGPGPGGLSMLGISLQVISHPMQVTKQAACTALAHQPRGLRGPFIKIGYSISLRPGSLNCTGQPELIPPTRICINCTT